LSGSFELVEKDLSTYQNRGRPASVLISAEILFHQLKGA